MLGSYRCESRCFIGLAGLRLTVKTNGALLNIKRPTKQMPDDRVIKKQFIGFMARESSSRPPPPAQICCALPPIVGLVRMVAGLLQRHESHSLSGQWRVLPPTQ